MPAPSFAALIDQFRERRREGSLDVAVVRAVDSTNLLARRIRQELGEDELPLPWTAVVAFRQTAGRGRQGRRWASPEGLGIYASVLGRLPEPSRLPVLPLAVAVALAEALDALVPGLRDHPGGGCRLKWPNDLLLGEGKLGGVLVETTSRAAVGPEVVAGFGVNSGAETGELPLPGAASLAGLGGVPPLATLAWELVEAVARELRSSEAAPQTVARWLARTRHRDGDRLRCQLPEQGEVVGLFRGIADDGRLRLEVSGRERLLVSAEVEET